jgi:hypothetical protein
MFALSTHIDVPNGALLAARESAKQSSNVLAVQLVPLLQLGHGLSNFGAAVGTLENQVDLRNVPMRLDLSNIHRQDSKAAGTDNRRRFDDMVMLNIGWHIGPPFPVGSALDPKPRSEPTAANQIHLINSAERLRNSGAMFASVAFP